MQQFAAPAHASQGIFVVLANLSKTAIFRYEDFGIGRIFYDDQFDNSRSGLCPPVNSEAPSPPWN